MQKVEAMAKTYGATPEQVKRLLRNRDALVILPQQFCAEKTAQFIVDNVAK